MSQSNSPRSHEARPRFGLRRTATLLSVAGLAAASALALSAPANAEPPAPTLATVYVSPGGIDSSTCGGVDQKCLTIQHGIERANDGGTVQVAAGEYDEGVTITKGINLQGAGAANTVINGEFPGNGVTPGPNGLVDIQSPAGDVTINGFTIENPFIGTVAGPYAITMTDPSAADHITISNNTITGSATDPDAATNAPVGIDSANTSAPTTITGNDFSDLWQAVLLEGNQGALDVSENHFHDLTQYNDGTNMYPAEGVYVLSDKESSATDQNVTDNTFDAYNGIGIAYSAGYNVAGCTGLVCDGSVTGAITGNTFDLAANDPGFLTTSAIRLRAANAGDELHLTMGNNNGTVAAPTKTIEESPGDGSITITPAASGPGDTIIPTPTPTVAENAPASVTTGAAATPFQASVTNPAGGDDIAHARYSIKITGTSGITAGDMTLKYETSPGSNTFATVPLSGAATAGNAITGIFGPTGGFPFPASATPNTTNFTLAVAGDAPVGALSSKVSLDEVSSGTGNPVINTVASDTDPINIVATQPTIADHADATHSGDPVSVTLPAAAGDHGPFTYAHGTASHGTVTGSGRSLTYTPSSTFVGTDTFTYTATDANDAVATGTETITVSRASSTLHAAFSPASPTSADTVSVKVTVTSTGSPNGGKVTVRNGSVTYTGTVVNKTATVKLRKYNGGAHGFAIAFAGTASAANASATAVVDVTKVKSTLTYKTTPAQIKTTTAAPKITVTVSSPGVTTNGVTVTIEAGSRVVASGKVSGGRAVITLPKLLAGLHRWTIHYAGNDSSAAATLNARVTVTKG